MSKDDREFWEKNIKPNNKHLWINKLKWRFYLAGMWVKKRRVTGVSDVHFSVSDFWNLAYYLLILGMVSMVLGMVMDVLQFIYPSLRYEIIPEASRGGDLWGAATYTLRRILDR